MSWLKPWRNKKVSQQSVKEEKINSVTTRISPAKNLWNDTSVAPLDSEVRPHLKKKKTYYDTYKNTKWDDEDYYNESAFPTHGQSSYSNVGQTFIWKNGKRVQDHKAIENRSTYRQNKVEVKKDYAWAETRWSSFNFNNFSYAQRDEDANTDLFIKEPESYATPTASAIRGKILVYSTAHINTVKSLCRLFYFKMLDEKDYINPNIIHVIGVTSFEKEQSFFEKAYDGYVPGFSPLDQAINYYQAVLDKERKVGNGLGSGTDTISFKREDFCNPALNMQMKMNTLSNKYSIEILNKISIIGKLGYQFQVEKETGEREVANSDIYRVKTMTSYAQLDRVALYQRVLPTYRHKFLTKALQVNVPVECSEKKQKIIILLDYSGSMGSDKKQHWVNSILADRFRYVIEGEAEVFFSYFVDSISGLKFSHVKNEADVKKFWQSFSNFPSGGNTDIGRIVNYVADEVKGGQKLHNLKNLNLSVEKPEILIINDGQDAVNSKEFPYKVNAISLMQFSDQLKNLCIKTGGKQVQVQESERITTYSSDGSAILQS